MSRDPQIQKLSDLDVGETADCFVLLAAKERGRTRDGSPFFRALFRDARRTATAMIWNDSPWFRACEGDWAPGGFYKIRCRFFESQYGPQIEIQKIREIEEGDAEDGFTESDFYIATRFDVEAMFEELAEIVAREIEDEPLQALVAGLLNDHADAIKTAAAATRNHHAFQGGYLEHVLSVTKTCVFLAEKYNDLYPHMQPRLSKSLVVAGGVLHDVGKLRELSSLPQGASYTAAGRLIGHILLGRDMLREKAREIGDLDEETLLRLEHVIVSHQSRPEWGSPIPPLSPEALLVHYADDVDAKFQMMAAALSGPVESDAEFTNRDNPLRRELFRGLRGPS
jgi:3'-5' exoribonuclease